MSNTPQEAISKFKPARKILQALIDFSAVLEENISVESALSTNKESLESLRQEVASEKELLASYKNDLTEALGNIEEAKSEASRITGAAARDAVKMASEASDKAAKSIYDAEKAVAELKVNATAQGNRIREEQAALQKQTAAIQEEVIRQSDDLKELVALVAAEKAKYEELTAVLKRL